jgi:SPP1 gp7 family putative phage head morphogenesis protein
LKYKKALQALTSRMFLETRQKIRELFRSETSRDFFSQQKEAAMDADISNDAKNVMNALLAKFEGLFALKAKPTAETMVDGAKQTSKTALHASLSELSGGLSLKTGVVPEGMEDVANAIVSENVSLIRSIPSQYFTQVTGLVMRSITTGSGLASLIPEINRHAGVTERRVTNIALDQTRKAYNSINKQRMQDLGVKQFEWIHSGGGQHPRASHVAMSGKVFSFDDLPVINLEQVQAGYESPIKGIPGQAINCKCVMNPVIKFDDV